MSNKWGVVFLLSLIMNIGFWPGYPQPLYAHAEYERSDPPADAVLPEPPAEVQLWFSQELFRREGANVLEVFGPDGTQVDAGDSRIDDDDRTHMIVSLKPDLSGGEYTVKWRNLSLEDGDEDSGEFRFTVASGPAAGGEDSAAKTHASAPAPQPQGQLPCLGGLVLGSVFLIGLVWQRRA